MELEQAMEKIVELMDENKGLKEQVQSLELVNKEHNQNKEKLLSEITKLKESNMNYFMRLTQEKEEIEREEKEQHQQSQDDEQKEPTSWVDFMSEW